MRFPLAALALLGAMSCAQAEQIGEIVTNRNILTPNDTISLDGYDDPRVSGVACYTTRAITGGAASIVGMATDKAEFSVACRQVGPIEVDLEKLKKYDSEDVITVSQSVLFKRMHLRRFVDLKRKAILYVVFSDYIIDGSPKNSMSAVAVQPWGR